METVNITEYKILSAIVVIGHLVLENVYRRNRASVPKHPNKRDYRQLPL